MPKMIRDIYRPQRITVELIKRLARRKPPDRPREIRDNSGCLILRHQHKTGRLTLYAAIARGVRKSLCDARLLIDQPDLDEDDDDRLSLRDVRNKAQKLRGQHAGGRNFRAERQVEKGIPTLDGFLEDTYGPWVEDNRRSGTEMLRKLKTMAKRGKFGKVKLNEITSASLAPYVKKRKKEVTAETARKDVAALRAALSVAVQLGVIDRNPLLGVKLPMPEIDWNRRVVRAFTSDEKAALIEALEARDAAKREKRASANKWRKDRKRKELPSVGRFADVLTPAVVVSLETGLRRGELLAPTWPHIDLKDKTLHVKGENTKSFQTREIPLNKTAAKTLRDWWLQCGQPKSGLVFSRNGEQLTSLKKGFYAVIEAAGIERVGADGRRLNWHSLRHCFASELGAAGADPATIKELAGHADIATTARYLHSNEKRKRSAVELLSKAK